MRLVHTSRNKANTTERARTLLNVWIIEQKGFLQRMTANPTSEKARKGFALLSQQRRQEIASAGGRTAHARGKAHTFTPEEAQAALKKRWQRSET